MDSSSAETSSRRTRLFSIIGRPMLLVTSLAIVVLAVAVSCGGGGDDGNDDSSGASRDDDREIKIETFTPTVPGQETEVQATREQARGAEQTAAANTATARASDPNATPQAPAGGPPLSTQDPDAFRPPAAHLSDGTNQMDGVFGPYGLIDEESQSYVLIQAPFFDVGDDGLTVAPGAELELSIDGEIDPPSSITASVYTWDDNSAIPQDTKGNVGGHLWFVPTTDPLLSAPVNLENRAFTMPADPGRYVVQVRMDWPPDDRLDPVQQPLFVVYAFTVYVE